MGEEEGEGKRSRNGKILTQRVEKIASVGATIPGPLNGGDWASNADMKVSSWALTATSSSKLPSSGCAPSLVWEGPHRLPHKPGKLVLKDPS